MQCSAPFPRTPFGKLHAIGDTKGWPIHLALTQGERHEMIMADELVAHAGGCALIGDTGYDSDPFANRIRAGS